MVSQLVVESGDSILGRSYQIMGTCQCHCFVDVALLELNSTSCTGLTYAIYLAYIIYTTVYPRVPSLGVGSIMICAAPGPGTIWCGGEIAKVRLAL